MAEQPIGTTIDYDASFAQFLEFYRKLSQEALIYILPSQMGLQDQVYVANLGCHLPHLKEKDTILISNFKSLPRIGEEKVGKEFFTNMGYKVYQPPFNWEGEADCFDQETEILTNYGWKFFKELDKTEFVMTYNPKNNMLEYQKPINYQIIPYTGNLIQFQNKNINSLVSPNHQVFCKNTGENGYTLKLAKDMCKRFYFKTGGHNWAGNEINYFKVPNVPNRKTDHRNYNFPIEQWLKFLGWFIAEGYANKKNYQICISQSKMANHKKYLEIKNLLIDMGFKVSCGKWMLVINSKRLSLYLSTLGQSRSLNENYCKKYIPKEIKQLSSRLLKILIENMMKGDGHYGSHGKYYATNSKQLADDFQEICLKCGYSAIIGKTIKKINGGVFHGFKVHFRNRPDTIFSKFKKKWVKNMGQFIYDVTVPQYHILLVRRHGKPFLSGNCKYIEKNRYFGGYGIRSDFQAYQWMQKRFDMEIIAIEMNDPKLYHLDCSILPLPNGKILTVKDTIPRLWHKIYDIITIPDEFKYDAWTNSLILNNKWFYKLTAQDYLKSCAALEKIIIDNGFEPVECNLNEFEKSGAALSCCIMKLNYC